MILQKINYFEHENEPNYWRVRDVNLSSINLIVGLNATGKTRLMNIISNLTKILTKKVKTNGSWELEFKNLDNNEIYKYKLNIVKNVVVKEEITQNGNELLKREEDKGALFSFRENKPIEIFPPKNELTLSVRRDRVEFPFFEELINWSENFYGYTFTGARPNEVTIPNTPAALLENLNTVPYLLVEALKDPQIRDSIINDFCEVGYPIKDIKVTSGLIPNAPPGLRLVELQETDLSCSTNQLFMSQGMFRAFSLIVIIEYILKMNKYCTVAIDDLGEGLDYERATKITNLLFKKITGSKIQLIVTSNDRFLINAANVRYLNILERQGHIVDSFNYLNSKEKFEEFETMGLNVFDFFSGKMYKENKNEKS